MHQIAPTQETNTETPNSVIDPFQLETIPNIPNNVRTSAITVFKNFVSYNNPPVLGIPLLYREQTIQFISVSVLVHS